jgi:plasmid stabilization system protein ParE
MMRLIYTPKSLDDFDSILRHIGKDNPPAAVRLGEDILRTCELLEENPELGVSKDDLTKGMRRFMCRGYGLYYRIDEQLSVVKVLRILHPSLDVGQQSFD